MKTIEYNPYLLGFNKTKLRRIESDIKAEIYYRLKEYNIESHLEYWMDNPYYNRTRQRIDIIVLKNNQIICLIEVKDTNNKPNKWFHYQSDAMEATGLTCFYCIGMDDVERIVKEIIMLHDNIK